MSFGLRKRKFNSNTDTKIGPWFWFLIPKPNFGLTLDKTPQNIRSAPSKSKTEVAPSNRHTMHSVVVRKNLLKGV